MLRGMCSRARSVITGVVLLLGLTTGACSGDGPSAQSSPGGSEPQTTATDDAPSLRERAAPYDIAYRGVSGKIPRGERARVLRSVTRPLRAWVDAGFVEGPWPRERFAAAFTPFRPDAARMARRNARLLTMQALGPTLDEVVPQRRRVRVSVTAFRGRPAGATARVDLKVFALNRVQNRLSVQVRGEVYLTPTDGQGWQIFGYDLDRWIERKGAAQAQGGGA
jgi:hypothetical protein